MREEEIKIVDVTMEKKDEDIETTTRSTREKGGMITMPFIFGTEVTEKIAVVGFSANMISYLTSQLNMPLTKAANTLTNFGGTAGLTPLIGAFIADSYAGRFWSVVVASIIYLFGMIGLILSATIPQLRPPPCKAEEAACQEANGGQLAIFYVSMLLAAIGAGGIRPCVAPFGADQFDRKKGGKRWNYFNWYYFVMEVSMLVAVTAVVYLQDNVGWGLGLGIPTFLMLLSVLFFASGYKLYRMPNPVGSPFTRMLQVSVAAWRKRKLNMVHDPAELYENDEMDGPISLDGKLLHTNHMNFLDKAAIITAEDRINHQQKGSPNLWRLSTVYRVEEVKSVIRMLPIWASGILLYTAYAQQSTFSLQQAKSMDRHLTAKFQIPAGSMSVFTIVTMLVTIIFYVRILVPSMRPLTGLDRGISFLHRIGIGYVFSILATLIAGFMEVKRKAVAREHGLTDMGQMTVPISVWWLAPQYSLHGVAEAFVLIGQMEFFYDQAPETMRSTASALLWTSISAGNYISTFLVTLIHKFSNWLPDQSLNKGKLEYFYWVITLLQVVNFVYYLFCAKFYTYKPVQVHAASEGEAGQC